jgi:hypothetical protein
MEVFRWLYSKSGFNFSQIDKIQIDIMCQIKEALMNEDLETVKFLLSLPVTTDSMVSETLAKAKNERLCIWIKQNGPILKHLKAGDLEGINVNSLHMHFIEFILSPRSANFSENVIKSLVNVLLGHYRSRPFETLETLKVQYLKHKLPKIADFLQRLIEIRETPEHIALCEERIIPVPGLPFPMDVAIAARAIEDDIQQYELKSLDPFIKEIRASKY